MTFPIHNQYKATDNVFFAKLIYDAIPETQRASACIGCGECETKCPQKIKIPAYMKIIADEFK